MVAGMILLILSGCMVGPDFESPSSPDVDSYTASPLPKETEATAVSGGTAQHLDFTGRLSDQWWKMFGSEELNALIKEGLAQNPSLTAASEAIIKAHENLRAAGGALLSPNIDASLSATKQKTSAASSGGISDRFHLLSASVDVSYTLDMFGASRRQLEGLSAQVDYRRFEYEASYLTLTSNLVTTAIQEASLAAQIATTKETVASEKKQLALTKKQFEIGAIAKESVLTLQTQLARTRATLPLLQKQLAVTRHALAALTGRLPGEGGLPTFDLNGLHLPVELPVSLPSTLVRQRPDIRASEALLHQASAAVGVATANLYPQITLSASYGGQSTSLNNLLADQNTFWNLGAGLLQPIFHGGELEARRRAAIAAYNQAAAEYRTTVLFAFENVADVLRALDSDAQALQAQAEADVAAKANLELTRQQFKLGATNYLSLLVAQQFYQQGRIGLVIARAQRYADTAALFQALGGGWWNRLESPIEDLLDNNSKN